MICKWCGAPMDRAARTCGRCGGERPALSDCGGFYDLVQASRPAPAQAPAEIRAPRKPKVGIWMLLSALLALALVVALVVNTSLQADYQAIKDRKDDDRNIQSLQIRELAQQDVQVTVGMENREDGYAMLVAPSLEAEVTVECKPDLGFGRIKGYRAVVDFSGKEHAQAQITLDEETDGKLQLRCLLDEQFGEAKDAGFTVESLIYVDGDGNQTQLSLEPARKQNDEAAKQEDQADKEDVSDKKDAADKKDKSDEDEEEPAEQMEENAQLVTVEPVDGETVITLDYAVLQTMAKEQELDETGTFQLAVCRENKKGGSFRVVVERITLSQE